MAEISNQQIQTLSKWLKILAEPNRLLILNQIMQGVQCNCELGGQLNIAPNLISHHLGILKDAGILHVQRDPLDARWVYYSINPNALEEINQLLSLFFDAERIQSRLITCGPKIAMCEQQK